MNAIIVVGAVLLSIIFVYIGFVVFKMMDEARRAKSIWHAHTSPVTSLSVQMPLPPKVVSGHNKKLLDTGLGLAVDYSGPNKPFTLIVVVDDWIRPKKVDDVIHSRVYVRHAKKEAGDGVLIQMGESVSNTGIFWEVKQTLHRIHVAGSPPDQPVHVMVCSSPRVALLRAVWERTKGTPETWFYVVDGALLRMWIVETIRLSLYYVARCFGKLRRFAVPRINKQAVQ